MPALSCIFREMKTGITNVDYGIINLMSHESKLSDLGVLDGTLTMHHLAYITEARKELARTRTSLGCGADFR